jgi:hypothetical protein
MRTLNPTSLFLFSHLPVGNIQTFQEDYAHPAK